MTLLEQANTLAQTGQFNEAITLYDAVLAEEPHHAPAWCNRGNPLHDLGRVDEALESFDRAIAINPAHYQSFCNKGVALMDAMRFEEALTAFNQCITLAPDFALAYSNRGNVHRALHAYSLALADYVRATELDPSLVIAHWNESTCRLHMGDYDLGWKKHEWRWQTELLRSQTANTPRTTWTLGDPIAGKSFTIWPEGGYGDAIQFTRFAIDLRLLGAIVVIAAPAPLLQLYQDSFKDFKVLPMVDNMGMPECDYHCSIMSLPVVCGVTSTDKLTTPIPYIFTNSLKQKSWQERLLKHRTNALRIGLTWAGNPKTGADLDRSLHLRQFENLQAACKGEAEFFSLQKGDSSQQVAHLRTENWRGPSLIDYTEELEDWSDTAALIDNLDLVISCDTATAHLAAAMGKPVWLLSRYNGCWRWLADRSDSPWYPSVHIFRQPSLGDWATVMHEVSTLLAAKYTYT
jgi:hypothetical protein